MKIVGLKILDDFMKRHADIRSQLSAWLYEVEAADWSSPNEIKKRYVHASFLKDNHVIFNIKGNNYRLEAKVSYKLKVVRVKRIGTHADYSKWKL